MSRCTAFHFCLSCCCLFILHALNFVLFLFLLVSGVGCDLCLWHSMDYFAGWTYYSTINSSSDISPAHGTTLHAQVSLQLTSQSEGRHIYIMSSLENSVCPWRGSSPGPPALEANVLATGILHFILYKNNYLYSWECAEAYFFSYNQFAEIES